MPKSLSNEPLANTPSLPTSFLTGIHQFDVLAPRISFAIQSLATKPTAVLYCHIHALAEALNTKASSRGVRTPFEHLKETDFIKTRNISLFGKQSFVIASLTQKGDALANQLGYAKIPNDWERITFNRKISEQEYLGQVIQIAYQCRLRSVEVEVSPWMVEENPPDLLIGKEKYWTYATGTQVLSPETLSKLALAAKAANRPLAIITKDKTPREKMTNSCKRLGIAAQFSELKYLFNITKNKPDNNKEFKQLWMQQV
ncbi:MAG: hypothetical protein RBT34_08805 [Anaerolineaceae bacterium]|jgi:hypothetical protein|nr:hypothetical protein [Anaerolineaceae bacterium]MDY0280579.1 hypothetical protein [Salinivirgaceae bacterium]